jgi:hypothetical protein
MSYNFPELLHQAERIKEYRDKVRGSLFQIHNIMTEFFPELEIQSLREMMRILDDDFKHSVIEPINDINHQIYKEV